MEKIFLQIRERARQIVSTYPRQPFYQENDHAVQQSRNLFDKHPVIKKLIDLVEQNMANNLGHGMDHAIKVTLDAGALMFIEGTSAGYAESRIHRYVFLAQCAGLLHDVKRSQKQHAEKGAVFVKKTLDSWDSFAPEEVVCIACAIQNHEAFTKQKPSKTIENELVSNCLYDADKFRWGPDNFMYTVWDMIESAGVPFTEFVNHYPKGMLALQKIRTSFRTKTGMKFGPQFIDTGLAIGRELYEVIQREFAVPHR
ncbi:MAG: hypothetical protein C4522_11030 [Desulfobacteraceae bacterium]|nr:MAG: hypothetical protein C4522_11030 [Desulfobacteraceae bacterium]